MATIKAIRCKLNSFLPQTIINRAGRVSGRGPQGGEEVKTSTKVWVVVSLLLVAGAASSVIYISNRGFSAREEPSWIEELMARHARRIATPAGAMELKNPFPQTEASLAEAREHYVEHCSICHGIDGHGNTTIGRNLYPKVPDMTSTDTQQLTDGELFYIISNGVRFTGMPAWGQRG